MNAHKPFCPCEECQIAREAWAAKQPAMLADLDESDGEDAGDTPEIAVKWKVQLPDYPCVHLVTGLTTMRGASGKRLLVADAQWFRNGIGGRTCNDPVTLMLLHDAIVAKTPGPLTPNRLSLYGSKKNQSLIISRIAGAVVEKIS